MAGISEEQMAKLLKGLEDRFHAKMDQQAAKMDQQAAQQAAKMDQQYGKLSQQIGALNERQLRKVIGHFHGEEFAQQLTLTCLEDLAQYVLDCDVGRRTSATDAIEATDKLAHELLTQSAPETFLRMLHTGMSTADCTELVECLTDHPWFDSDGKMLVQGIGEWIGSVGRLENKPGAVGKKISNLQKVVGSVLAVIKDSREQAKIDLLKCRGSDGSVGLLLAQFIAGTTRYDLKNLDLPSWSIQCDVRGNIMLFEAKAQLSVGEIKSSPSGYGDAVKQLIRRLALLHWAVKKLRESIKEFFKVGHVYMPRNDAAQMLKPETVDDVLVYVHYM